MKKEEQKPVSSNSNKCEEQNASVAHKPVSTELFKIVATTSLELRVSKHMLSKSTKLAVICERVRGQLCLIQVKQKLQANDRLLMNRKCLFSIY